MYYLLLIKTVKCKYFSITDSISTLDILIDQASGIKNYSVILPGNIFNGVKLILIDSIRYLGIRGKEIKYQ